MKSGVKTDTVVCNRRNHGTNNNYVLFIIETKKNVSIGSHWSQELGVLENRNKHSQCFLTSSMLVVYYQYKQSDTCWEEKSPQNYNTNYVFGSMETVFSPERCWKEECFFFCFLIARESNQDIGQSSFFPSEGWKRKNILKNVIKGISMVGKYKATLSAQD